MKDLSVTATDKQKKLKEFKLLNTLPLKRLISLKKVYSKFAEESLEAGHEEDAAVYKIKIVYLSKAIEINKKNR